MRRNLHALIILLTLAKSLLKGKWNPNKWNKRTKNRYTLIVWPRWRGSFGIPVSIGNVKTKIQHGGFSILQLWVFSPKCVFQNISSFFTCFGLYILSAAYCKANSVKNDEVPLLQTVVFLHHFRIKKALFNSYTVYDFYMQRMIALPRKRLAFCTRQQLSKENVPWLIKHRRSIKITNKTSIINPEANCDSPALWNCEETFTNQSW